jgi:hypothetical protein
MGWTDWEKVTGEGLDFTDIVYEKKFHTELGGGVGGELPWEFAACGVPLEERARRADDAVAACAACGGGRR